MPAGARDVGAEQTEPRIRVRERIVGHKGKRGTPGHKYLVKWKGYGPFHTSWEPASDVKADQLVQRYEAELIKKR